MTNHSAKIGSSQEAHNTAPFAKTTTMNVMQAIERRRSIKHYDPDYQISEDDFQKLMQAVILSPTSYNVQNWRFVRVKDRALRSQLKDAAWGQKQVEEASELLILCGDLNAWDRAPQRYWRSANQETQDFMVNMMRSFYGDKPQIQRDEVMRSCGIAGQTLMLAAEAMGLSTCPMVGYDEKEVARLIQLPEDYVISMMITLGKAATPAHPRGGQLPLGEVLVEDVFR